MCVSNDIRFTISTKTLILVGGLQHHVHESRVCSHIYLNLAEDFSLS